AGLVARGAQLALEFCGRRVVEILLPVERRRAVVGEHLVRMHLAQAAGGAAREVEVGRAGLAADEVGVLGVGDATRERLVEALARAVEAFGGSLAREERLV